MEDWNKGLKLLKKYMSEIEDIEKEQKFFLIENIPSELTESRCREKYIDFNCQCKFLNDRISECCATSAKNIDLVQRGRMHLSEIYDDEYTCYIFSLHFAIRMKECPRELHHCLSPMNKEINL